MAIKGLSIPVCGKYLNTGGTVTYSDAFVADHAVEYGVSWTTGDDNPFYADNQIQENDKGTFQSGELTLATADLPQEISKMLLGTTSYEDTYGAEKTATVQVFDDSTVAPYLGFGIIEMHQIDDVDKYRAVFFPKVYFSLPEEAATTKGESIEWQQKEITGVIQRSDEVSTNLKHPWMLDAWFDTEADALEWLEYKCGGTAEEATLTNEEDASYYA